MPGVVYSASPNPVISVGRTNQQLYAAIALKPVVVSVDIDSTIWKQYTGGVITSYDCLSQGK